MPNSHHGLCDGCAKTVPIDEMQMSEDGSERHCRECQEKEKDAPFKIPFDQISKERQYQIDREDAICFLEEALDYLTGKDDSHPYFDEDEIETINRALVCY